MSVEPKKAFSESHLFFFIFGTMGKCANYLSLPSEEVGQRPGD